MVPASPRPAVRREGKLPSSAGWYVANVLSGAGDFPFACQRVVQVMSASSPNLSNIVADVDRAGSFGVLDEEDAVKMMDFSHIGFRPIGGCSDRLQIVVTALSELLDHQFLPFHVYNEIHCLQILRHVIDVTISAHVASAVCPRSCIY